MSNIKRLRRTTKYSLKLDDDLAQLLKDIARMVGYESNLKLEITPRGFNILDVKVVRGTQSMITYVEAESEYPSVSYVNNLLIDLMFILSPELQMSYSWQGKVALIEFTRNSK